MPDTADRYAEANQQMLDIFRRYNVTEVNGEPWTPPQDRPQGE